MTLTAKRKGILGFFGDLANSIKSSPGGIVTHDGVSFEEAVAEIQVGGRRRRVGIFGPNSDAGVIDLSDSIVRGADGHPTFASMVRESGDLLKEFQDILSGRQP